MTNPIDFSKPPLWKNPCHVNQGESDVDYITESDVSIKDILSKVHVLTSNALDELNWKDAWVQHAFQKDFNTQFSEMKSSMNPPAYLPTFSEINKNLGEPIADDHLSALDKTVMLQKTYELLQRVAIGMEQIVSDQYSQNEEYKEKFKGAYYALRSVLCEVSEAMNNLKVKPSKTVDRTDMPESEREISDTTSRKLRDWTIFVTYINLLEYTKQAIDHLSNQES